MKKRKYWLIIFVIVFILFLHSSFAVFAETKAPFSCKYVFSDRKLYIRQQIQGLIHKLGGAAFVEKYKLAQGLLTLSNEIHKSSSYPESLDFIKMIYEVVSNSNILSQDDSQDDIESLKWIPFYGTRYELAALTHGFFNEKGQLREEGDKNFVFLFKKGNQISIGGQKGFKRLARRVFEGDEDTASLYAVAVLTEEQLQDIGWHHLLLIQDFLNNVKNITWLEVMRGFRKFKNKEKGDLKNQKGKVVELMIQDNFESLKGFFRKRGFKILIDHIKSNVEEEFSVEKLQNSPQKDNPFLKANEENEIKGQFDFLIPVHEQKSKKKSSIIVEAKYTLIPEHIDKFLAKLKVIDLFFPDLYRHTFFGAFAFINADQETLNEANEKGLFLIRLKPEFIEENFGKFKPAEFPLDSHFSEFL